MRIDVSIRLHYGSIGAMVIGATANHASRQILYGRPAIRVGVDGGPLTMVVGVRGMDRGRSFHGVMPRGRTVHGIGGGWPRVDIHGIGMALAASPPCGSSGTRGRVIGIRTGGRFIGLIHKSVDGIEVLVSSGAL